MQIFIFYEQHALQIIFKHHFDNNHYFTGCITSDDHNSRKNLQYEYGISKKSKHIIIRSERIIKTLVGLTIINMRDSSIRSLDVHIIKTQRDTTRFCAELLLHLTTLSSLVITRKVLRGQHVV